MINNKETNENVESDSIDKSINSSEGKDNDRILPDGVILELMKKSDWEGCKRFFTNIGLMALTVYTIHKLDIFPSILEAHNLKQWQAILLDKKMLFDKKK